jgi:hypothetical protein
MRILTSIVPCLQDPDAIAVVARCFLQANVLQNRMLIRARLVPPLYKSGVRYEPEPRWARLIDSRGRYLQFEDFATALDVLNRGWGDCDDLAPWICAERQETCGCGHMFTEHAPLPPRAARTGEPRSPFAVTRGPCTLCTNCREFHGEAANILVTYRVHLLRNGHKRPGFHALCRRGDGTTEDPSRYLGL